MPKDADPAKPPAKAGRVKPPKEATGPVPILPSPEAKLRMIEFALLRLRRRASHSEPCGSREAAAVMLSGRARVKGGSFDAEIGGRTSVFEGPGACAFWPQGAEVSIEALDDGAEIALARVEAAGDAEGFVVAPGDVNVFSRGKVPFEREIRDMIDASRPASRMVLGETVNAAGQWSSYPPHRHERDDPPNEVSMEEAYYFRVEPAQGFGFIRLYTDDREIDEAYAVEDGDVVAMPRGYHPVSAAPGYRLYYLWVLAGESSRELRPRDDPRHAWVLEGG
jgi:5-deoxy-glucuronate isomerase